MNLQHLRYALEIERTGSISQAAKNLEVAQPNLSRAVKELESQLGISVFERSGKGMNVTPAGEKLLRSGERILRDLSELEQMFDLGSRERTTFSIMGPPAEYLAHAFATMPARLPAGTSLNLAYREIGLTDAIIAMGHGDGQVGIIRYATHFDHYYREYLEQKHLSFQLLSEFSPVLLCGRNSPLATAGKIADARLEDLVEIVHVDALLPHPERDDTDIGASRITVSERAAAFSLLQSNPDAYMWSSPLTDPDGYNLCQRPAEGEVSVYRDVLIYPKDYSLSNTDRLFVDAVNEIRKTCL